MDLQRMAVFGTHDENTLKQLADVAGRAERVALMADGHFGYIMPVGGVAAYHNKVSVAGVGFDIACGNAAIRTDLILNDIADGVSIVDVERNPSRAMGNRGLNALADEIQATLSFGIGRKNSCDDAPVDDPLFLDPAWWLIPNGGAARGFREELTEKARRQLGTIGSGNHYVDVFADQKNRVWVGVHFGSRGFGHTVASGFMARAAGKTWGERVPETEALLDLDSELGREYWALMELAGRYAYTGREWVARKVVSILGGTEQELVHNHHNFAWKEIHPGLDGAEMEYVVVRKGATPAFPGQRGFIGGSMGDDAVIVRGADPVRAVKHDGYEYDEQVLDLQERALSSTVHGAGRVMSRTAAAGKYDRKTGQLKSAGLVSPEMMHRWLGDRGVVLRGGGLDESPHAYRRLPEVLAAQGGTVEIEQVLRPIIVVMAGANEYDPYKD